MVRSIERGWPHCKVFRRDIAAGCIAFLKRVGNLTNAEQTVGRGGFALLTARRDVVVPRACARARSDPFSVPRTMGYELCSWSARMGAMLYRATAL
eukprot:6570852-Pyramimonas_sp.AAC.1